MRSRRDRCMLGSVPDRAILELDQSDPISGVLYDPDGDAQRFSGWLELISRIEELWERRRCSPERSAQDER
jgi:hypothetical protein